MQYQLSQTLEFTRIFPSHRHAIKGFPKFINFTQSSFHCLVKRCTTKLRSAQFMNALQEILSYISGVHIDIPIVSNCALLSPNLYLFAYQYNYKLYMQKLSSVI